MGVGDALCVQSQRRSQFKGFVALPHARIFYFFGYKNEYFCAFFFRIKDIPNNINKLYEYKAIHKFSFINSLLY